MAAEDMTWGHQVIFDGVVVYSGWAAGLLSLAYNGYQHMESRRQRAQADQLSELLARADQPIILGGDRPGAVHNVSRPVGANERVRATLIRAASAGQPLRSVRQHLRQIGCEDREVLLAVRDLESRGVLRADMPLSF